MYTRRSLTLALMLAALMPAQEAVPTIQVTGNVKQPLTLTAEDLKKMPRAAVRADSGGKETDFEGVWLHEVLAKAGVPLNSALRGKALSTYVLAEAQDGYQILFSLAEIDPSFIDNEILLVDTANGKPLPAGQGPFRLIVPKEHAAARSIRMLTKLEVVQLRK